MNLSSIGGKMTLPWFTLYSASTKYAIGSLTDGLRMELRRAGIHSMTVCPGYVNTRFQPNVLHGDVPPALAGTRARGPSPGAVRGGIVRGLIRNANRRHARDRLAADRTGADRPGARPRPARTRVPPAGIERMKLKLKRTPGIYLVGFMGCGKTTIGRMYAEEIGWRFADLDDDIEAQHRAIISELFEEWARKNFAASNPTRSGSGSI